MVTHLLWNSTSDIEFFPEETVLKVFAAIGNTGA